MQSWSKIEWKIWEISEAGSDLTTEKNIFGLHGDNDTSNGDFVPIMHCTCSVEEEVMVAVIAKTLTLDDTKLCSSQTCSNISWNVEPLQCINKK